MQIQYSKNCESAIDMQAFCQALADALISLNLYPLGGLRVRAAAQDFAVIADGHQDNKFIDMVFRIGQGRSEADKVKTGKLVQDTAEKFLGSVLTDGHFMLSLEIVEISKTLSWKTNSVHKRLQKQGG